VIVVHPKLASLALGLSTADIVTSLTSTVKFVNKVKFMFKINLSPPLTPYFSASSTYFCCIATILYLLAAISMSKFYNQRLMGRMRTSS